MEDLENKLGAILGNPEMMGKIMALAQSFGEGQPEPEQKSPSHPSFPDIDISLLQKLSGAAKHTGIDQNQRSLLNALGPYISSRRLGKLERAMRAAKMAGLAGIFLNSAGR
ncbi:MAG: hypothetical protein IJO45_03090 [Oscillospiraceae bacterium]|nr:hypothetical protein [Oscillospiraceae bacterium]